MPGHPASSGKRLHPAAVAVWFLEGAGRFVFGFVPLALVESRWIVIGGLALLVTVAMSVARYLRFTYAIEGGALVVEGGLLNRWRRVIPVERIQSIDVVEKLRHRAFGVVELRIEAAGGRETEASLVALRPGEAVSLREALTGGAPARPDVAAAPLATLGPGQLLLAGVTGGRVAVIAVILGYAQQFAPDDLMEQAFERLGDRGAAGLILLLGAIAAFLAASVVVSIIGTVVVYWGFTLHREGDRLVVRRGLLELRRAVVPLRRLQAIRLEANLIRRLLNMASLTAVTAGRAGRSDEERQTNVLLPVATRTEALAVASAILGMSPDSLSIELEAPPRRALVPPVLPAALLAVAAVLFGLASAWALATLSGLATLAALAGWQSWRARGHRLVHDLVIVRWGILGRITAFIPPDRLQHLTLSVTPVQRWLALASVRLAVPKARVRIGNLDRAVAEARFDQVAGGMLGEAPR